METLKKMGTWTLTDLLKDWETIGCRWTFVRKRDENGSIIQWKARLVAQGFSQKPGTDYNNNSTFTPVMWFETLCTILAHAAINKLHLRQFKIKGAYLNGYLNKTIYMWQLPGFKNGSTKVCLLIRSLYGLKQARNVWNHELNWVLLNMEFKQLKPDYCCYIKGTEEEYTILVIWVDDFLATSANEDLNNKIEKSLNNHFKVKSLGQSTLLLSIKTHIKTKMITLSQTQYIDFLLDKYRLKDANPVLTPMDPNIKLEMEAKEQKKEVEAEAYPNLEHGYAQLIRSLMYLASATRPNISYAVNWLAQFTSNPKAVHWTAVKRVFRYLKYTKSANLTYGGKEAINNTNINFFSDADWGNNSDQKLISGYVTIIAGGAVAWSSKKQQTVTLSTAEAKYIATTHAAKQVLWHWSLYTELDFKLPTTSTIFTDNQVAISISHHPKFHTHTKHIDIKYHFLYNLILAKTINTVYVNNKNNLANIFTKGLSRSIHQDLTHRIRVLLLSRYCLVTTTGLH